MRVIPMETASRSSRGGKTGPFSAASSSLRSPDDRFYLTLTVFCARDENPAVSLTVTLTMNVPRLR